MEVKHKLEDGKLIHEVLEKALDTGWKEATRMKELQTDTAVILMGYGELKAKGLPDGEIIEQIARGLLPIGFDMVYWRKKVREVLKRYGITIKKALDTQTAGEGYEWIPEGYARRRIKRVKIHRIDLNEMKELKKARFLLRLHTWKGQLVVRGMSVDHWDLVLDKGERCLDEFAGMENNPLDQPEGVSCIRHPCCGETPEGKPNKEWIKFEGDIPPEDAKLKKVRILEEIRE